MSASAPIPGQPIQRLARARLARGVVAQASGHTPSREQISGFLLQARDRPRDPAGQWDRRGGLQRLGLGRLCRQDDREVPDSRWTQARLPHARADSQVRFQLV